MAKEKKRIIEKIVNFGASIITAHDNMQIKMDKAIKKIGHKIVDAMAAVINGHDLAQLYVERGCFIAKYHIANSIHKRRKSAIQYKKQILGYFAGGLLVAIGIVAMFNYATAYEYSYNGKTLGYVKNQDEVIKILDVASTELTKEYGTQININPDTDISFKRVVSLDKDIDNVDTVLKKFTYMSDMLSEGYGIYIDGELYAVLSSKAQAEEVLTTLQTGYTPEKDKTEYERIGFKEDVEIKAVNVKLAYIDSVSRAVEKISTGSQAQTVYVVKSGDTYYEICETYGKTMDELKANNPNLNENELYAGQEIIITNAVSALTVQTVEKSTFAEVVKYKTEYRESADMYEGDSTVTQAGSDGRRVVTARITRENGVEVNRDVLESETITQDVTEIITKGTAERPKTAPTGSFSTPIRSGYVLSPPIR